MVQMNLFAGQEQRCRHREQMCRPGVGDGINWEIRINVCAQPCIKQIASGNLLHSAGSSAQCSGVTKRNGMRGSVGSPRVRGYMYTYS